jgi:alpha-ribazole phosphatase/probable phosphoglycerate mutase
MTLLFIRHAETDLSGTFCGSSDPPLNDKGRTQIPALAAHIASFNVARIFSSDLLRARQTTDALAASLNAPVITHASLREIDFGEWEGLTWAQIEQRDPIFATRWVAEFPALTAPGGEPIASFRHRVVNEIMWLRSVPEETIAIVTHAGVLRVLLEEFGHLAPEHAWERTRSYASVIRCTQRSPQGALEVHP